MPHPRILKILKMSAQEWGALPPESESPKRRELKAQAVNLLMEEDAKNPKSMTARLDAIENRLRNLESFGGRREGS